MLLLCVVTGWCYWVVLLCIPITILNRVGSFLNPNRYKHSISSHHRMSDVQQTNDSSGSTRHGAKLIPLYNAIKCIPETEHVHLLRIIVRHARESVNENNNGCFVNLTILSDQCISELDSYVKFIHTKNTAVCNMEKRLGEIASSYF